MKKTIIFLFYSLLLCVLAGCFASGMSSKNDKKWIPADFDPKNMVLLVEANHFMNSVDKEKEDYMKKNYPYRFEFVVLPIIKLKPEKYSDTTLYRYAIMSKLYYIYTPHVSPFSDFIFYDRVNNKDYPGSKKGGTKAITTFQRVIDALVKYAEK